ncbi:hypothetical protein DSO57_1013312 [Entomophthora muscae]|uniref:Uncharacterized protein n=1 Tax=Entomophthora muscae TaxID=34485 RepID=A0ACC2TGK2_9FUNG|nr:hypothetical protein DSO57_1013312 [Entomophthora muscae]
MYDILATSTEAYVNQYNLSKADKFFFSQALKKLKVFHQNFTSLSSSPVSDEIILSNEINLNFLSYNARGLCNNNKRQKTMRYFKDKSFDLVCLQETQHPDIFKNTSVMTGKLS